MRTLAVFSLLFLAICSYAQRKLPLDKRACLVHQSYEPTFDTTGFHALPAFEYFCDNQNKNAWEYYHVLDLNHDGLDDLLYCGPCMPYEQTAIFLNDGRKMNMVHNYPGSVVSIDRQKHSTVIQIFKKACCCDPFSNLIEITVNDRSQVVKDLITFSRETEIPANL